MEIELADLNSLSSLQPKELKEELEDEELRAKEKARFRNIKNLLEFDFFHLKKQEFKKDKKKVKTKSLDDSLRQKVIIKCNYENFQ